MTKQAHVSGKLMTRIQPGWYDRTALVESYTATIDSGGEETATWATVAGLGAVPCRISPVTGRQERLHAKGTVTDATHAATLSGDRAIDTRMRVTVDGTAYDIVGVARDSERITTHLDLRVVTT